MVLGAHIGQEKIDQHDANSKARNALFSCLLIPEFEQVSNLDTSHKICSTLERYHEGSSLVETRLFEMHH